MEGDAQQAEQAGTAESEEWFLGFHIEALLGKGGLGAVHRISYQGKPYALKRVLAKWAAEEVHSRRLLREGRLLQLLRHPNVVEVHDTGVTREGVVWIRMELLDGLNLRDVLARRRALSPTLTCAYLVQAARGAFQGHDIGAIHRDLKPENLFVTRPHVLKVVDWGIARLAGKADTLDQQTHGTPLYMSPEQIRQRDLTPASDIYALGMIAHEALAGRHPFVRPGAAVDPYALFHQHFHEVPASLEERGVPERIAAVIARAIEKDPERRFKDGEVFADAVLEAWAMDLQRAPEGLSAPGEPSAEQLLRVLAELNDMELRPLRAVVEARRPRPFFEPALAPTEPGSAALTAVATTEPVVISTGPAAGEGTPGAAAAAGGRGRTMRLPDAQRDPSCVAAEQAAAKPGREKTMRLPDAQRDPSCIEALEGRRPKAMSAVIRMPRASAPSWSGEAPPSVIIGERSSALPARLSEPPGSAPPGSTLPVPAPPSSTPSGPAPSSMFSTSRIDPRALRGLSIAATMGLGVVLTLGVYVVVQLVRTPAAPAPAVATSPSGSPSASADAGADPVAEAGAGAEAEADPGADPGADPVADPVAGAGAKPPAQPQPRAKDQPLVPPASQPRKAPASPPRDRLPKVIDDDELFQMPAKPASPAPRKPPRPF